MTFTISAYWLGVASGAVGTFILMAVVAWWTDSDEE